MTFRVATLNLHQGFKRWNERCHLIVDQFGALSLDILALNEISVPLQTGRWLQAEINKRFQLRYSFLQQNKAGGWGEDEAQGLLTRFPIIETGSLDYQARGRVAQVVRLEIEGRLTDVYVTHLHHVEAEDGLRQFQVQRLFQWIKSRDDLNTCIVCGDFNASPNSRSIRLVPKAFRAVQTAPTWPTGLSTPGETSTIQGESILSLCMDYIWITEDLVIEGAGRCFDKPDPKDATLWPSDHVGVWADLSFRLQSPRY